MDKMVVIVFDDESKAYEGSRALMDLHDENSLTVYEYAVIAKDSKGVLSVKQARDQGPVGTGVGFATGALVGLLGGPVGVAIGATSGTIAGSFYDLAQVGISEDFINEVSAYLSPGKTAIVAEVDEDWVTPLDTRMDAFGGIVFRRARGEFIDAQIEQDIEVTKSEIKELRAEYNQAAEEDRARLLAKLDSAQRRLQAQRDGIKEKIDGIKQEEDAKVRSLQEQAAKAKGEVKSKLEKRVAEVRADHEARIERLSKAWQLIKEAAAI
jgi:uncharacterized membrane protein